MNLELENKLMSNLYIQRNGCWIYKGTWDDYGYGQLGYNGTRDRVHVISFKCFKGCIPKGMYVCHTCDEPPCFNPDHLYLGTHYDNIQDMWKSGRGVTPDTVGSQNGSAFLCEEEVLEIRRLYAMNHYSQTHLGVLFKVDNSTIWKIVHRKKWTHI